MTRVLVTGAGGFIGGHVLDSVPEEWDVVALSRRAPPADTSSHWVTSPSLEQVPDEVTRQLFDAVIHLAGNADHGLAAREPWQDLMSTGVVGAAVLGRIDARRIVLLSSAAVYAGLEGRVGPDARVEPLMPYALSKLYVEGFVRSLVAAGRADSAATIRLYNAYGPGERPTRLIPRVVEAIQTSSPFRLTGNPDSLSDPVYVRDVAGALIAAARTSVDGTWDLCGGDARPLEQQIARIAGALGQSPPPIERFPDPTQVPITFHSDPTPIVSALGISMPRAFEDGIRAYASDVGWGLRS